MAVQVTRRRFTVDDYHRMAAAGILSEDSRVELLGGEIIEMVPISNRHATAVRRLIHLFSPLAAAGAVVLDVQDPVRLGDYAEPQPDVALLRARADLYAASAPAPADVLLIIEVMESSVSYDRQIKLPLYAEAGVPEVWLVDLQAQTVDVFRRPAGGEYGEVRTLRRGASIAPEAVPEAVLHVVDVLGNRAVG
jgi:hypothetical protein